MAERLGDRETQGRALNTLGASRAKLGDLEDGIAMLRRSRDLFLETGPPAEHAQARTNLSDLLDLAGRPEEALEEVRAGMAAIRVHPERTHDDTFLELQGVNLLIRMGRLAELEPGLPAAPFGDDVGTTPMLLHQLRATVAVLTGELDRARSELAELRRLCVGSRDPQFLEPLHGLTARLALLQDRLPDARAAIADGLAALAECEEALEHVRLVWTGLMVEATAAERARALGEPVDAAAGDRLLGALAEAEVKPGLWQEGRHYAALARAEATRLRGEPQPEAWEAAAEGFDGLGQTWPAAYARFRAVEAHVQGGDRRGRGRAAAGGLRGGARDGRDAAGRRDRGALPPRAAAARGRGGRRRRRGRGRRLPGRAARPHAARARGAAAGRGGPDEPRDRRHAVHEREDRQRARLPDHRQARRRRPRRGGGGRPPARPDRRLRAGFTLLPCSSRVAPPPVRLLLLRVRFARGSGQS